MRGRATDLEMEAWDGDEGDWQGLVDYFSSASVTLCFAYQMGITVVIMGTIYFYIIKFIVSIVAVDIQSAMLTPPVQFPRV